MSDAVKRRSMCEQAIFWLHKRAIRQYEWVHDHQVRGILHTTCKLYAKLDRTDIPQLKGVSPNIRAKFRIKEIFHVSIVKELNLLLRKTRWGATFSPFC